MKALFLDQGRGTRAAALGHVRVRDALEAGLADAVLANLDFRTVGPSSRLGRLFTRPVPGLGVANLWSVRFALSRSLQARRLLAGYLRAHEPDVVHVTTDQVALLLDRLWDRVPFALSLDSLYVDWNRLTHGVAPADPTPWYLRPNGWLEARALDRAAVVVAWTETVAAAVRRAAPGARVATLHPGLDLAAFAPPERPPRPGSRVLFVGGRWHEKGGPRLVDALAPWLGHDVHLDVVTTVAVEPREGVQVHAAGPGSPELHRLFAAADLFCLPTGADACPWVVLEAMAYGLPVVSTDVGSIPELIGDGGVVVGPGDTAALRAALGGLLGDAEERRRLGRAGRARVERHYDARRNAPRLIALLEEVAAA